jgi:hypothetical protein
LTWAAQFADQFRDGILYPRWLPQSFDALGSPTFYFYPPVAFWVDALVSVLTFNALPTTYRLSLSWLVLLWASGLAMHAWLKAQASSPRVALYGALAYMAAPYHLLDHYYRGAYAEFAAYVILPLIVLALHQIARRQRFGPVWFALSYAALPMTHLPTALLISVTVPPAYVLYCGWRLGSAKRAIGFFIRCGLGAVLGLGLAAIYLLPALALQGWIQSETFWVPFYQVENWFLLTPGRWPRPIDTVRIIAWIALAYGIAAIGVLILLDRKDDSRGSRFWAWLCIVCLLLVGGVVSWFWELPFVAKVQFPWRLMIVVEFAIITALAMAPWSKRTRVSTVVFVLAGIALAPAVGEMTAGIDLRMKASLRGRQEVPQDLNQFLPSGFQRKPDWGYADLGLEPLQGTPIVDCAPMPRNCRSGDMSRGDLRLEIETDVPTTVVLRRFYFPGWQLDPALPLRPTDPFRLVSFTAPPGSHTYWLRRSAVHEERLGWIVTGLSFALLLAWAAAVRRGIRFA